jgi:hypothetical protein
MIVLLVVVQREYLATLTAIAIDRISGNVTIGFTIRNLFLERI